MQVSTSARPMMSAQKRARTRTVAGRPMNQLSARGRRQTKPYGVVKLMENRVRRGVVNAQAATNARGLVFRLSTVRRNRIRDDHWVSSRKRGTQISVPGRTNRQNHAEGKKHLGEK